ncbi:bifunctional serine/threonine protein kinase/MFS transporter [Nocardia carnea]|uniref:non-specific serine/threonine protein kinase n=1 Tax=Nocardia carnea TaxID=37328 RepID=A0ABW7TQD1_9NOCA|nr:bifunctional serine/threonine protein kinase/MFS transporter [Nocardia carnea]
MLGVGATFAGYQVEGVLGRGGMGTVYLARHPRLPRSVALKLLNREVSTDPELSRRFEREADVVARLEHPGIVGVFDRGTDDGHLWIAMQYIRGTDAASWDARAYPPATAVRLLGETAAALDYAHSCGVLHRDVKPANILIAGADAFRESHAVLTDFGIARLTDATNTKLTATGTFTATLAYGSPEQLTGEPVDHRSDQYSLACTLFTILAGRSPYAATNPGQVVMGHISQPVPRLTAARPDLPPAIDAVLERGMAKKREDRFVSCAEFTTAARDTLEGRHIAAPVSRSVPTVVNRPPHVPRTPPAAEPAPPPSAPSAWPLPGPEIGRHPYPYRPDMGGRQEWAGPKPSRVAPFTAAIITLLAGLAPTGLFFVLLVFSIDLATGDDPFRELDTAIIGLLGAAMAMLLWTAAGMYLLSGNRIGRILTIICSVIGMLIPAIGLVGLTFDGELVPIAVVVFGSLMIITGLALVCASSSSTGRWIQYRTAIRNARIRR